MEERCPVQYELCETGPVETRDQAVQQCRHLRCGADDDTTGVQAGDGAGPGQPGGGLQVQVPQLGPSPGDWNRSRHSLDLPEIEIVC